MRVWRVIRLHVRDNQPVGNEPDTEVDRVVLERDNQWSERFPNTITRAMSYGKPVICSRIGALPEIVIDGQTGLLHEPNDLDELVGHVKRLYSRPELCRSMGEQGRRRVMEEYSRERVYDRLIQIYQRAMQSNSPADTKSQAPS